jgi:hypothetical protein
VIVGPPAAPLASAMTVSLVLVSPSTCEDQHVHASQLPNDLNNLPIATLYVCLQRRLALLSLCGYRPYTNYASS